MQPELVKDHRLCLKSGSNSIEVAKGKVLHRSSEILVVPPSCVALTPRAEDVAALAAQSPRGDGRARGQVQSSFLASAGRCWELPHRQARRGRGGRVPAALAAQRALSLAEPSSEYIATESREVTAVKTPPRGRAARP